MTAESSSIYLPEAMSHIPSQRPKPGPKVRPIQDRNWKMPRPVTRKEERHSKARRLAVVMFIYHHRVFDPDSSFSIDGYRKPFQREAAAYFQINRRTISDWVRQDFKSEEVKKRSYHPQWPQLERRLFQDFMVLRQKQCAITTSWFRKRANEIFRESVSSEDQVKLFTFSNGWWLGFKRRFNIVKRRVTKRASQPPEALFNVCGAFCKYIRRVQHNPKLSPQKQSANPEMDISYILSTPSRRFSKRHTINVDETPIPFTNDAGSTWDQLGAKTISIKTARSGWEKRQATLILYIFGDGICRLKPKIIFYGAEGDKGRIFSNEGDQYAPGITVTYNDHAYNNEALFKTWIKDELSTVKSETEDFLLVMDAARFHLTDEIKAEVRLQGITTALVPAGCTGLLQPLDVSINKLFKQYYREEMLLYELEEEAKGKAEWSVSDRRIMTTWITLRAWERIKNEREKIEKSFLDTGITSRPDGSEDTNINIKGLGTIDFTGWENASDISIKSEELVDRLCDNEEFTFGPDEEFNEDTLIFALDNLKVPQLRSLLAKSKLPTGGNKKDLVERLQHHFTEAGTVKDCITVQIDNPEVIFEVE